MKTVVGMFSDVSEAQRSFEDLMKFGVGPNDISVVTRQQGTRPTDGLNLFAVEVPDAGPIAARGPIASMLSRDQNGLLSTLRGAGVSAALAEHYVKAVRQGETLEFVMVEDRNAERVVEIMRRHAARYGAADVTAESPPPRQPVTAAATIPATGTAARTGLAGTVDRAREAVTEKVAEKKETVAERRAEVGGSIADRGVNREESRVIPILREELQVGKREIERGAVHVGVHVTERPVSEHIRLREEHVEIDRRPIDRAPRADELEFRAGEIDLIEHGEEVVVSKQVRVVEEVRLHKRVTEHEETIHDKLRSTEIDIDQLAGDRKAYALHYESLGAKGNFDEMRPAYEYGRGLRRSHTEQWSDIEPNARASWETRHPGTWQRFQDAIRYAWSRARAS